MALFNLKFKDIILKNTFSARIELESTFHVALSSRVTALTYKEIFSLQKIFVDIDRAITDLTLRERGILPLTIAESFYQKLKDLDWLKLPDRDELKIIDQQNSN